MAQPKIYQYTVRGFGNFPIDMLRFDQSWPASEAESGNITRPPFEGVIKMRDVVLRTIRPQVTDGRWISFGWTVTERPKLCPI